MKLTLEQQYMLSVQQSQYLACWCSGDFRSQGIIRLDIDPQKPEYSVSSIRRVDINPDDLIVWKIPFTWSFEAWLN